MPRALIFEEGVNCFSNRDLMLRFALGRIRTLLYLANFFLGSLPTARLGAFASLFAAKDSSNPLGTTAAAPEPIVAIGAISGVPGVDKQTHDDRQKSKRECLPGQTAVQKRYKLKAVV